MPSLCDRPTERRPPSPLRSGNTSSSRCRLGWLTPQPLTPGWLPRLYNISPHLEVLCYLDDTAVHSADAWSHLRILRKVLAAFRVAGLQISPEKAQLFQDHIKYLGHEVSAQGISIPSEYISVIKEWPIPNTIKTLRAFLGKCGYYRRFIADYATLSAPLVQYT